MTDSLMVYELANRIAEIDSLIKTQVIPNLNQPVTIISSFNWIQFTINLLVVLIRVGSLYFTGKSIKQNWILRSQERKDRLTKESNDREDRYKLAAFENKFRALSNLRYIVA